MIDFAEALEIISPRGITNPFRIQPAVAPPPGAFSAAIAYGFLSRDDVVIGSSRKDPQQFISGRPGQMRAPKKLEVQTQALVLNYGITDRLAAFLSMPYVEKHGEAYQKDPKTGAIRTEQSHNDGWGDLDLRVRYNLWRTAYYDRFFTLLTGMTLPTGGFDRKYIDSPGLQLGTGAVSVTPGLLFSARWSHLWLHWSGTYSVKTENSDDYRFGDEFATGVALHFTPHYDLMVGVEADATLSDKNEYKGKDVENTGGTRTNLTFVGDWRFWNAWGGNFTLRGSIGLPVYEDLNSQRMGEATRAQLGGGFYANVVVSYTTQFDLL